MKKILDHVRAARAAIFNEKAKPLLDLAETEDRELTPGEWETIQAVKAELAPLDERIAELIELEARNKVATDEAPVGVVVRSEPLTYQRGDRRQSYFRDLGVGVIGGDVQAKERLARHRAEMDVELPKREARAEAAMEKALDSLSTRDRQAAAERRDITRTDGAGGEFVPPLWLLDDYAELARAGRVTADLCRRIPLPTGTDSINIPRITTGTAAAVQTADNGPVNEQDIVTTSVEGKVRTIAGQQDIALQLLEQSPLVFDELVFADLAADYNAKLNVQVLNGSGASGQHDGFLHLSGTNSISYTDGSPTVPELFPFGAQAISQAATGRKLPPTAHVMHARRWFWMLAALDSNSRPLVVPTANGAYMAQGVQTDVLAEGPVGFWHGLPVYLDQGIPVLFTAGAGAAGTEDAILTARFSDAVLFEGALRTRALPEVLSGNLTVRLQVYGYSAFICGRQPAGISKVVGTGLAAPSGF